MTLLYSQKDASSDENCNLSILIAVLMGSNVNITNILNISTNLPMCSILMDTNHVLGIKSVTQSWISLPTS